MTDERAVQIMLRFGYEGKPIDEARNKLRQAAAEFQGLEKKAQETRKAIATAMSQGKETGELDKQLQKIEADLKDIGAAARKYVGDQARQSINQMREAGEKLRTLGTPFTVTGLAIFAGVGQAIRQYTQYVGQTTEVSSRWLNATREMEQSYMRLGAVAADRMLPVMEKLADVTSDVASFVEQHPEVVDGALKVATAMLGIGGGLQIAGQTMVMAAAAKQLGLFGGGATAGGGTAAVVAAASSVLITAIVPIVVTATLAYLANKTVLAPYNADTYGGGQAGRRDALQNYYNAQFGQDKTTTPTGNATDWIDRLGDSAEEAAPKVKELTQAILPAAAVDAYVQYRKAETQAEEQYNQQRTQIVEEYSRQRVEIELRYEQQRTQIVEAFARQQAQALQDFQRMQAEAREDFLAAEAQFEQDYIQQRADAAAALHDELAKLERDFRKRMRQLEREHQSRMDDLVASRDALGMVAEQRRYEEERRQAQEEYRQQVADARARYQEQMAELDQNYQLEKQRRQQAFEEQQADQAQQFAIQRAREQEQYKLQLEALDKQHKEELRKLEENKNAQLRSLDDQYRREKETRRRAFIEQLNQLQVFQGEQLTKWQQFYQSMRTELEQFITDMQNAVPEANSTTGKAIGGYASFGRYTLGEQGPEYILTASSTRALERSLGGRLTQAAVMGYGGGKGRTNLYQIFTFNGSLSAEERQWYRRVAREEASAGLLEALGA